MINIEPSELLLFFFFLIHMKKYEYVMISARPSGCVKNMNVAIFVEHYKCVKCQTLYDGTTHSALPVQSTSSDLDHT